MDKVCYSTLPGIPMVDAGDDLAQLIIQAAEQASLEWQMGDIVCIAQKIVSKAEGRLIPLSAVVPSQPAIELGAETDKDPRLVQLILDESTECLRQRPGVLIMRHRLGFVGAHAGIDQSNIDHGFKDRTKGGAEDEKALLLPADPDKSAANIRAALEQRLGKSVGVIITDSNNRPWRMGTIGAAIGCAGIKVLDDFRGGEDIYGRELKVTLINRADAIAAAATLLMGETTEKTPVVVVSGVPFNPSDEKAAIINRPLEEDLFR